MNRVQCKRAPCSTMYNNLRAPPGPALSLSPEKVPNFENLLQISPTVFERLINLPLIETDHNRFAEACLIPVGFVDIPTLKMHTQPHIKMFTTHIRNLAEQKGIESQYEFQNSSYCKDILGNLVSPFKMGSFEVSSTFSNPSAIAWYNQPFKAHEVKYARDEYDFNSYLPVVPLNYQKSSSKTSLPYFPLKFPSNSLRFPSGPKKCNSFKTVSSGPLYPVKPCTKGYPKNELGWTKLPTFS